MQWTNLPQYKCTIKVAIVRKCSIRYCRSAGKKSKVPYLLRVHFAVSRRSLRKAGINQRCSRVRVRICYSKYTSVCFRYRSKVGLCNWVSAVSRLTSVTHTACDGKVMELSRINSQQFSSLVSSAKRPRLSTSITNGHGSNLTYEIITSTQKYKSYAGPTFGVLAQLFKVIISFCVYDRPMT